MTTAHVGASHVGTVTIIVDERPHRVPVGMSLAASLLHAHVRAFRTSVVGEARGPLCGMGSCYECRVTVDGVSQRRACLVLVTEGLNVRTGSST